MCCACFVCVCVLIVNVQLERWRNVLCHLLVTRRSELALLDPTLIVLCAAPIMQRLFFWSNGEFCMLLEMEISLKSLRDTAESYFQLQRYSSALFFASKLVQRCAGKLSFKLCFYYSNSSAKEIRVWGCAGVGPTSFSLFLVPTSSFSLSSLQPAPSALSLLPCQNTM